VKRLVLAFAVWVLAAAPALAGLTQASLASVGVWPPAGAHEPLALVFQDAAGRPMTLGHATAGKPAVLVFADYQCRTLCGPALVLTAAGLRQAGLKPGDDYRLVVIGLRPNEAPADAQAFADQRLKDDPALKAASAFLVGDARATQAAMAAVGFRARYDAANDQYAHEAAAFALTLDGRMARVLSEVNLSGPELRLAIVGAGEGRVGNMVDRLRWLCVCYGFDPAQGLYNAGTDLALKIGGALMALLVAGGLLFAHRRPARP